MERLFTEDTANALLPQLTGLLSELRDAHAKVIAAAAAAGHGSGSSNGSAAAATAVSDAERDYVSAAAAVEALGVIVRDASTGLIDFAAVRGDEAVYLCWRLGEARVAFWHPRDSGFMGRQPLH